MCNCKCYQAVKWILDQILEVSGAVHLMNWKTKKTKQLGLLQNIIFIVSESIDY